MIKKKCLLTIVTVVKNDEQRLKITLSSVKKLYKNHNYEFIIVENLDNNNKSPSKYLNEDNYIKYLNDDNNDNGIYNAMNLGTNRASGLYIMFLNAGDFILFTEKKLSNILKKIILDHHYANIIFLPSFLSFNSKKIFLKPNKKFFYSMPTSHQAMIFRTSFVKKHMFNLKYKIASDFDLLLKSCKEKLTFFDTKTPFVSIEYGGFSSKSYILSYYEYFHILYLNKLGIYKFYALIILSLKFFFILIPKTLFRDSLIFYFKKKIKKCL